jgi:hypothetical protein
MSDLALKPVQSGDKLAITAAGWNLITDAAMAYQQGRRSGAPTAGDTKRQTSNPVIIQVLNSSGADREHYDVLKLDGLVYSRTDNEGEFMYGRPVFDGKAPEIGTPYAVLLEPLESGEVGRACVAGVCQVQLNVIDADHQWADVDDAAYTLRTSNTGGARILWKDTGTGTKWAMVLLGAAGGTAESPDEITPTFDGETADTATWDIDDPETDTDGLTLRICSRVAYNHEGDKKLYGFYRDLTFNSRGCLAEVTAETRVEIDPAGACS